MKRDKRTQAAYDRLGVESLHSIHVDRLGHRHTHTFTIRVMGPPIREEQTAREVDAEYRQVDEILKGRVLGDVEDTLNDQLLEGWYAKVEDTL